MDCVDSERRPPAVIKESGLGSPKDDSSIYGAGVGPFGSPRDDSSVYGAGFGPALAREGRFRRRQQEPRSRVSGAPGTTPRFLAPASGPLWRAKGGPGGPSKNRGIGFREPQGRLLGLWRRLRARVGSFWILLDDSWRLLRFISIDSGITFGILFG